MSAKDYQRSAQGAMRDSISAKINTSLVPYELIACAAIGLNYGAEKYDERNFEKGFSLTQLTQSIQRHIYALEAGEPYDEDSGLPHVTLIASSVAMLCHNWMQQRVQRDIPVKQANYSIAKLACHARTIEQTAVKCRTESRGE